MRWFVIILVLFLSSCNPCKYVAKHPECFPADTVKVNNDVVRYVREYVVNDSIIRDTVPCDPITEKVVETKTVYRTKTIEKTDTIYQSVYKSKVNPVNTELKKDNEKLNVRNKVKNKVIAGLSILILLLLLFWKLTK